MRIATVCVVSSIALVAACSKSGEAGKAPGAEGAAAPATASVASPAARPRAGLWQMTMNTDAGPGIRLGGEMCMGEDTNWTSPQTGQTSPSNCEATQLQPVAGGMGFTSVCKSDGRTITTTGVAKGDFNSAYTTEFTQTIDPPVAGMAQTRTTMEAKWLGPCREGQVPGQMSVKLGGLGQG